MGIVNKDPADFRPSQENYSNMSPFRVWCQKVLPLVYDDSLSYYELLCKVVDYINLMIENIEHEEVNIANLNIAYGELEDYVNTYFSTLDVTNEINDKLDLMAKDGTLSALIQPLFDLYKSQIDPMIANQNSEIELLIRRMDTFQTLPAGSTTGNAELTDVRVPVAGFHNDKNYDTAGDAVRGQIATLKGITNEILDANGRAYLSSSNFVKGLVSGENGNVLEVEGYMYCAVSPIMQFSRKINFKAKAGYQLRCYLYYSDGSYQGDITFWTDNYVVPKNTKFRIAIRKVNYVQSEDANINLFLLNVTYNSVLYDTINSPYLYTETPDATHNFNTMLETGGYFVNVSDGTLLNAPRDLTNGTFMCTNFSMPFTDRFVLQKVLIQNPSQYRGEMWYRLINADTQSVSVGWLQENQTNYYPHISILGDSITAGYPFLDEDTRWYWGMHNGNIINPLARSGSGLLYKESNKNGITIIDDANLSNTDTLIIFMGTNDYGNSMPLGNIVDMYPTQQTVCGALNYIIDKARIKNSYINIIGILPLDRRLSSDPLRYGYDTPNSAGYTLTELNDKLKAIYDRKYVSCIPTRTAPINRWTFSYLTGDGLHPNKFGYRKLGQYLCSQLKSYIDNAPIA